MYKIQKEHNKSFYSNISYNISGVGSIMFPDLSCEQLNFGFKHYVIM